MINNTGLPIAGVWQWLVDAWNWLAGSGFFDTGQWAAEIVGELTDDHATGGPLDELQEQVGVEFPDLQALRQIVVDKWRAWQRSVLIRKPALLAYREAVKQFAIAFDAKKAEYFGGTPPTPIAGIWDWIQTNWKTLAIVGTVAGVGIGVAVVAARRK